MAHLNNDGTIYYNSLTRLEEVQASYIASNQDEYIIDDGISIYTGLMPWNWGSPGCSHTEVGYWLDGELWFFSSTSRKELGGKNGTRWVKGNELLKNPDRWKLQAKEFKAIAGGKIDLMARVYRANLLVGLAYDFYGVVADFVNPARVFIQRELIKVLREIKKIYCSKAVHAVQTGRLAVYSPRRKYKWAKKNGYKLKDTESYIKQRS